MRRTISTLTGCLLLLALAAVAGCASSARTEVDSVTGAPPGDFALDLIVRGDPAAFMSRPPLGWPGRYIVLPDGSLYAGEEQGGLRPDRTRTLSQAQVTELWRHLGDLGLADPAGASEPVNLDAVAAPTGGVAYLLTVTADGRRWIHATPWIPGEDADGPLTRLTRHLAALAWVADRPVSPVLAAPRRYDLGSDPYARYRRP